MSKEDLIARMRRDWDSRAAEDPKYFIACQRRNQDDTDFAGGAEDVLTRIRRDYPHILTGASPTQRRFLEIGCGIGRLMRHLSPECREVHGVDISDEMVARGRKQLAHLANVHFHVAQNDLSAFPDSAFDLVYSYAVFQHIPDQDLVLRYVDEAFRVLKPGGLLIGHFSGAPPFERDRNDTWVGASFGEAELLRYAGEKGWQALSSEGADTQYLWLTLRRPAQSAAPPADWTIKITAVLNPSDQPELIAGGPRGFATIYMERLRDDCADINGLAVRIGKAMAPIKYIGPSLPGDWRQINARIPETTEPGGHELILYSNGRAVSQAFPVTVRAMDPLPLRLISITDGEEIHLANLSRCGKLQINFDGCRDIQTLRITIGGRAPDKIEAYMNEPLTRRFQINVPVPAGLRGRQTVRIWVDNQELPAQDVDVDVKISA